MASAINLKIDKDMSILDQLKSALSEFISRGNAHPTKVRISKLAREEFGKLGLSKCEFAGEFFTKGTEAVFEEGKYCPCGLEVIVEECTEDDFKAAESGEYRFDFE